MSFCRFYISLRRQDYEAMKEDAKKYSTYEEEHDNLLSAQESVAAYVAEAPAMPDGVAYANIKDGVLQVTPNIEEEIAAVERGETVSMAEFKSMFARWL